VDSFKETPLARLNVSQLKYFLHEHLKIPSLNSCRKIKADFLVAIDDEVKKRDISRQSLCDQLKKLFPQ